MRKAQDKLKRAVLFLFLFFLVAEIGKDLNIALFFLKAFLTQKSYGSGRRRATDGGSHPPFIARIRRTSGRCIIIIINIIVIISQAELESQFYAPFATYLPLR